MRPMSEDPESSGVPPGGFGARKTIAVLAVVVAATAGYVAIRDHNDRLDDERAAIINSLSSSAVSDVDLEDFRVTSASDLAQVTVVVKNSGAFTASYRVMVAAESESGDVQYSTAVVVVASLAPGQTASRAAVFFDSVPAGAIARLKDVSRG